MSKPNKEMKPRTQVKRQKPAPMHFQKTVTDFNEAVTSLMALHNEVKTSLRYGETEEGHFMISGTNEITVDQAVEEISKYFAYDCLPQLIQKHNIHCSLNATANKVSIRTEQGISFGWDVKYVVADKHATVESVTVLFSIFNGSEELAKTVRDAGFQDRVNSTYSK